MPDRDRDELSPNMEDFKMEVAQELGLSHRIKSVNKDKSDSKQ
ncbi:small, acid-soluble spore protein, alpha/beta type [Heliobacterium chlorum]|uniref:Small, acid-soluble spore protein, alpha/beta type n=1 Tax=Heliobacterium chlorum TaxID=2698 RepID=A0ABR7SZA2_HELCL|nr:small, acid-soluble spore protein, alpha/beta type [Heliobacterium chlorum]MBC9783345.1 small, acid-soluble spore protein, alpha/beta type [Heliobacterium chlorum]